MFQVNKMNVENKKKYFAYDLCFYKMRTKPKENGYSDSNRLATAPRPGKTYQYDTSFKNP